MVPFFLKKIIQFPIEAYFGRFLFWQRHRETLRNIPSIPKAINSIQERWPIPLNDIKDNPIFIFSGGWRSGSTLLQRLVNSSGNILIWGEPYSHCEFIRKLAESLTIFRPGYPPDQFFIDHFEQQGEKSIQMKDAWVACLYPNPSDLLESHRQFFRALYAKPASMRGYSRWGLKEVRLSIDYAIYLKCLFPNSRFLFLYRNPYKAYQSYRTFGNWYDRWPLEPVFTPKKFGHMWRSLLEGYLEGHQEVDGFMVKYEDLSESRLPVAQLADFLNLNLKEDVLEVNVSGRGDRNLESIPLLERRLLKRAVEPLASKLGYTYK